MKTFTLLFLFLSISILVNAQSRKNDYLLPDSAFNRMITQDITYAIVGENAPISGVKIDISKPEGIIAGMFPLKDKYWLEIIGFELKGGVTDNTFGLLKGFNNANASYELKGAFHWFSNNNSGSFGDDAYAEPRKKMVYAKNEVVIINKNKTLDTIYVITSLYNHHAAVLNNPQPLPTVAGHDTPDRRKIAAYFIRKILNDPTLQIDTIQNLDTIISSFIKIELDSNQLIKQDTFYDDVANLYTKYQKIYTKIYETTLDKMILNASEVWKRKSYKWLTLAPFVKTEKATEYYKSFDGRDSTYFKQNYHWSFGISGSGNFYRLLPKRRYAVLARLGASLSHTNNLSNFDSYNYETKTPLFQYSPSVTEMIKSGSAYNNSDIKRDFAKEISIDLYLLQLRSMYPGLYLSGSFSNSNLYRLPDFVDRADDKMKISAEGGLVFNINNRDKDKSLLSIITYFRYSDLTDKLRTPAKTLIVEKRDSFQQRNISFGVKVGIPITLPKIAD